MDKCNHAILYSTIPMLEASVNLFAMSEDGVEFNVELIESVGFDFEKMPDIRVRGFVDECNGHPAFELWYTLDGYGTMTMAYGLPVGDGGKSNEGIFLDSLELLVTQYLDWEFLASLLG